MKPYQLILFFITISALISCARSNDAARGGKCFHCVSLSASDTTACGYEDKYEAQRAVKHNDANGLVAYDCTEMP